MERTTTLLTTAVATLLAAASAQAQEVVQKELGEGANPETMACTYQFTASNIKWCLSANGNLVSLQSPGTVEHINYGGMAQEGYVLCFNGTLRASDTAAAGAGFGPPTVIVAKSASGITIRRKTLDGYFQLDQKWSRDNTERDLTVQMTLKNLGPTGNVALWRVADLNVDFSLSGSYNNRFDQSRYSLWVRDPVNGRDGVTMSVLTLGTLNGAGLRQYPGMPGVATCNVTALPYPGGPLDVVGYVGYGFSSMASGAQKVVKVGYRVE